MGFKSVNPLVLDVGRASSPPSPQAGGPGLSTEAATLVLARRQVATHPDNVLHRPLWALSQARALRRPVRTEEGGDGGRPKGDCCQGVP